MIHVRIDNHHPTALDIYVNISHPPKSSSTPLIDEHIYDRLFDSNNFTPRQSKIVKNRTDYIPSFNKKNYTLQQILDNVETIQQQYEKVIHNRKTPSSCFFTFKHLTKILKNLRTIKTKPVDQSIENSYSEIKSPFIFGGETLQWIALPRHDDENHIYENEFIH
jgi:hypothetical protein